MKKLVPLLLLAGVLASPTAALGYAEMRPVGSPPLSDWEAAELVVPSEEVRARNDWSNARLPTDWELQDFRERSTMPYRDRVTGGFVGSTDDIIEWAAYKHGVDEDVLRAVARQESYWRNDTIGDGGDSFGLMQMRRPWHCCLPYMAESTAFNVDYYAAYLRAYYDGEMTWLHWVDGNGRTYEAGDLWGSVGVWFSGRWHDEPAEEYIRGVQEIHRTREWTWPEFVDAG
jgi:soluble lytic murein transglycosylase-like protein